MALAEIETLTLLQLFATLCILLSQSADDYFRIRVDDLSSAFNLSKSEVVSVLETGSRQNEHAPQPPQKKKKPHRKKTGSDIAKGGYAAEERVRWLIKTDSRIFPEILILAGKNHPKPDPTRLKNNSKTDIKLGPVNIQCKSKTSGGDGQVDRCWLGNLAKQIPMSDLVKKILTDLCVKPPNETNPRKVQYGQTPQFLKKYPSYQLALVIAYFENNKRRIVELVFLGIKEETKPHILAGIFGGKYEPQLLLWRMDEVIDYLCTQPVKIRRSHTTIEIGDSLYFQRKGGDKKALSSNQCQFKLNLDNLKKSLKPKTINLN